MLCQFCQKKKKIYIWPRSTLEVLVTKTEKVSANNPLEAIFANPKQYSAWDFAEGKIKRYIKDIVAWKLWC